MATSHELPSLQSMGDFMEQAWQPSDVHELRSILNT